jgi:hypothetical protein
VRYPVDIPQHVLTKARPTYQVLGCYTELLPEANERVDLAASGMSLSLSNIPRPSRPASTMTHRRMQWRIELRMRAAAGESIARYDQP